MEGTRTNRNGDRHLEQGGEGHMKSALTDIEERDELDDVTDQYVGPSALTIANLLTLRYVRYRQGWFWTTTAICHGGDSQGLAFRQRPDGNGIDARCHTRGCARDEAIAGLETVTGVAIAGLETVTGVAIGSAYVPVVRPPDRFRWLVRELVWFGGAAALFAVTLLLGLGLQAAILTWLGYGLGGLLIGRPMPRLKVGRPTR